MGTLRIDRLDTLPKPPALVCDLKCEEVRKAAFPAKQPKPGALKDSLKYQDMSGTVKIVVVNRNPLKDCCENFWAAVLALGTMLIGIVVFAVLIFAAGDYKDKWHENLDKLHVPLCTMGFVLLSGPGIMAINSVYGPSAYLKYKGRTIDHGLIVFFGLVCGVVGGALCLGNKKTYDLQGFHYLCGIISYVLGTLSLMTGIGVAVTKTLKILIVWKVLHAVTGMLAFLAYAACFISSFFFPVFRRWARGIINWYYLLLIIMALMFTIIILFVPLLKCCKNYKICREIHKTVCTREQTAAYIIAEQQKQEYFEEIVDERKEEERTRAAMRYKKSNKHGRKHEQIQYTE